MIKSFSHKGLAELWSEGQTAKIDARLHARILERLDALEAAPKAEAMNVPGFDFHKLKGKPERYTVHVNGPWCIIFEFEGGDARKVDLVNYH